MIPEWLLWHHKYGDFVISHKFPKPMQSNDEEHFPAHQTHPRKDVAWCKLTHIQNIFSTLIRCLMKFPNFPEMFVMNHPPSQTVSVSLRRQESFRSRVVGHGVECWYSYEEYLESNRSLACYKLKATRFMGFYHTPFLGDTDNFCFSRKAGNGYHTSLKIVECINQLYKFDFEREMLDDKKTGVDPHDSSHPA